MFDVVFVEIVGVVFMCLYSDGGVGCMFGYFVGGIYCGGD